MGSPQGAHPPTPGNHEYNTTDAAPYYAYFGTNAGPVGLGYYGYNLGTWHIIALSSNIDAGAESAQARRLIADLAAHRTTCALAYWHHPVFSSGSHGNGPIYAGDLAHPRLVRRRCRDQRPRT